MRVCVCVVPSQMEWGKAVLGILAIDGDQQRPEISAMAVAEVAEHESEVRF